MRAFSKKIFKTYTVGSHFEMTERRHEAVRFASQKDVPHDFEGLFWIPSKGMNEFSFDTIEFREWTGDYNFGMLYEGRSLVWKESDEYEGEWRWSDVGEFPWPGKSGAYEPFDFEANGWQEINLSSLPPQAQIFGDWPELRIDDSEPITFGPEPEPVLSVSEKEPVSTKCPGCDGEGEYSFPEAAANFHSDGWFKCERCDGTGKITPRNSTDETALTSK